MRLHLATLLFVSLSQFASAQMTMPAHSMKPTTNIEGSKHPELIPDTLIIRLFSKHAGALETDDGQTLNGKAALLTSIGLSDTDTSTLAQILAEFNITNAAVIARHNAKTNRTSADFAAFTHERDTGATNALARSITNTITIGATVYGGTTNYTPVVWSQYFSETSTVTAPMFLNHPGTSNIVGRADFKCAFNAVAIS